MALSEHFYLALVALGISKDDEVDYFESIMEAFMVPLPVEYVGAKPVFVRIKI